MKKKLYSLLFLIAAVWVCGCTGKNETNSKPETFAQITSFHTQKPGGSDAQPEPAMLVNLSIYRILVPSKTISRNEDFWKHAIEDEPLDVAVRERLLANGFRVGIASRNDWPFFKNAMENYSLISQMTGTASTTASQIEMPVKTGLMSQRLLWLHSDYGLIGDMYDKSENVLTVHFVPIRRRPGDVRISLTPMIRVERTEIKYTVRNEAQELTFVHPEYIFDLRLMADIPLDHFLIVGTSTHADAATSLGRAFLIQENNGQEYEQLLLISPQPFQLNAPTSKAATKPADARAAK